MAPATIQDRKSLYSWGVSTMSIGTVEQMYDSVKYLGQAEHLSAGNLVHFPTLNSLSKDELKSLQEFVGIV